jgi:hypothetical protein
MVKVAKVVQLLALLCIICLVLYAVQATQVVEVQKELIRLQAFEDTDLEPQLQWRIYELETARKHLEREVNGQRETMRLMLVEEGCKLPEGR